MLLSCMLLSSACADDGRAGASFSLVVDDPPRPVGAVSYDIVCEDGEPLHDQLDTLDDVLPSLWGSFVELPAGHCEVALTALDADGVPLCTGDIAFDVAVGEIAEPTVVMACGSQEPAAATTVIIEEININVCTVVVVGIRNISQGTGSFEDSSEGDLTLEVTTIGQCSDAGLDTELIAEAIVNDPELSELSSGSSCDAAACDDGNDCTENNCLQDVCVVSEKADATACNDGLGSCEQGTCVEPEAASSPQSPETLPVAEQPSQELPVAP